MGCWVRPNASGTITFELYYRGMRWCESAGEPYSDPVALQKAEALRHLIKASMKAGRFDQDYLGFFRSGNRAERFGGAPVVRSGREIFSTFAAQFLAERQPPLYRPSYGRTLGIVLEKWVTPSLGHLELAAITPSDIAALRQRILLAGKSVKYARNIITSAQSVLSEAVRRGLIERNPAAGLHWPRQPRQEIDPLESWAQVEKVLCYIRKKSVPVWRYVLALAETGMRPSEAAGLCWQDVDLTEEGRIQIRRSSDRGVLSATKTVGSERTLYPIADRLLSELRQMQPLRVSPGMRVFVGVTGKPINQARVYERHWLPALRAVKIRTRRLYELRHTFISLGLSSAPPANPQWMAEYTGTSLEMIRLHYGRFLRADSAKPLAFLGGKKQKNHQRSSAKP